MLSMSMVMMMMIPSYSLGTIYRFSFEGFLKAFHHYPLTLFEIFIFCPNFPWKLSNFFGWKTREKVVGLDFLAVDNFDFTWKIVKQIWVKNLWKCWSFVKIEFLDKNLTFRIVWRTRPQKCIKQDGLLKKQFLCFQSLHLPVVATINKLMTIIIDFRAIHPDHRQNFAARRRHLQKALLLVQFSSLGSSKEWPLTLLRTVVNPITRWFVCISTMSKVDKILLVSLLFKWNVFKTYEFAKK